MPINTQIFAREKRMLANLAMFNGLAINPHAIAAVPVSRQINLISKSAWGSNSMAAFNFPLTIDGFWHFCWNGLNVKWRPVPQRPSHRLIMQWLQTGGWVNDEVKNCLLVIYYGLRMACCRYKQMTMSHYCDSIASRCGIFKRGRRQRSVNYHSAVFIFRVSALPLSLRHSVFQWANKKRNLSCADYRFHLFVN